MAQTQEYYRLQTRQPRYATLLSSFANGMYVTNQTIPESYAKYLINYDIDDTGSYIRPKRGRMPFQGIILDSPYAGPVTLTDYLYCYNKERDEGSGTIAAGTYIVDTLDTVISLGRFSTIKDLLPESNSEDDKAYYICKLTEDIDTTEYGTNDEGQQVVIRPGEVSTVSSDSGWGLVHQKNGDFFDRLLNENIGYVSGRTLRDCYGFDKKFKSYLGRPIYTILNNEMLAFVGQPLYWRSFPNTPSKNALTRTEPVLSKIKIKETDSTEFPYAMYYEPIVVNDVSISEAAASGYNILKSDPYTFSNVSNAGKFSILGVVTTDGLGKIILTPDKGVSYTFNVYYQYPVSGTPQIKVESLDGDAYASDDNIHWIVEQDFTSFTAGKTAYKYNYVPTHNITYLRFTIRNGTDTATETPFTVSIDTTDKTYKNVNLGYFDLVSAKGMITWQRCVGVYGVKNAENVIFFSATEDPGYFPYPNNRLSFDNEVYAVYNYLDHLLVVTASSIWLVKQGSTIQGSTQNKIMDNINISELDACNIVILKDEIFFKTSNSFYVLKPNQYTSDASDLKKYVNSTAIANLTNNFTSEIVKLLNAVYKNIWQAKTVEKAKQIRFVDFDLLDNESYLRDEEVHYIYKIEPKLNVPRRWVVSEHESVGYLNVHLVYNTLTRAWRLYFTTIGDEDIAYGNVLYRDKKSGEMIEFIVKQWKNAKDYSDVVVSKQSYSVVDDNLFDFQSLWELSPYYNNFNYIDTGNVSLNDISLKRFRELQIAIHSTEKEKLDFYVDFRIDGAERVAATKYETESITDPNDPQYGVLFVRPIETPNMWKYQASNLGEVADPEPYWYNDDDTMSKLWQLDLSAFPDLDTINMKIQLIGKGRRGSIQLLSTSLKTYELANWLWAYRLMNVR